MFFQSNYSKFEISKAICQMKINPLWLSFSIGNPFQWVMMKRNFPKPKIAIQKYQIKYWKSFQCYIFQMLNSINHFAFKYDILWLTFFERTASFKFWFAIGLFKYVLDTFLSSIQTLRNTDHFSIQARLKSNWVPLSISYSWFFPFLFS